MGNTSSALEISIRILCRASHERPIRIQRPGPVLSYLLITDHLFYLIIRQPGNLVYFVRRTKTIKKMQERDPGTQCDGVRNHCHILRLLDRGG